MFSKATRKFVDEIDPDGCLIPVSRLNESDNLTVLSLVIKRNPVWFWQQPRFMPTDFTLNDVLLGDSINTVLIETDFINYKRTMKNDGGGGAEAGIGPGNLTIEGKGLFKLASSFGNLKKQEVDVQKLLHACKDRKLDFKHSLLKQTQRRRRDVFAVVKERIMTTQTCTVTEEVQEEGSCSAFLGFRVPKNIQVSVKNGSIHCDSNVFIEIPAKTVLAYSLMELNVRSTGQFELCLMPDTLGHLEVDSPNATNASLLCSTPPISPVRKLQEDLDELQVQFTVLSKLPASTRACLFQQITLLLKDKAAISTLNRAWEELLSNKTADLSTLDNVPSSTQTTLKLLKEIKHAGDASQSKLAATGVLISALGEMPESTLRVFESCCQQPTIQAMHSLVKKMIENEECSLADKTLAPLAEKDTYNKVQELFTSCNVMLSKEENLIRAEINNQQGHRPLILAIAIFSFASLVSSAD